MMKTIILDEAANIEENGDLIERTIINSKRGDRFNFICKLDEDGMPFLKIDVLTLDTTPGNSCFDVLSFQNNVSEGTINGLLVSDEVANIYKALIDFTKRKIPAVYLDSSTEENIILMKKRLLQKSSRGDRFNLNLSSTTITSIRILGMPSSSS